MGGSVPTHTEHFQASHEKNIYGEFFYFSLQPVSASRLRAVPTSPPRLKRHWPQIEAMHTGVGVSQRCPTISFVRMKPCIESVAGKELPMSCVEYRLLLL